MSKIKKEIKCLRIDGFQTKIATQEAPELPPSRDILNIQLMWGNSS